MRFTVDGRVVMATTGGALLDPAKPLLVFVHGAGGDRTMWALQTRYFAHHGWSVLALDLPGHGGSDGPAPDSVEAYGDWLATVIDASDFAAAAIAGHSLGSFIGLDVAARHPGLVTYLAMLATAATMPVHPALLAAAQAGDHLAVELITSWSFTKRSQLGRHATPGTWMTGRYLKVTERSLGGALGAGLIASNTYAGAVGAATQVRCPVLFLLGERDLMTPGEAASVLIDATPESVVDVVAGSGHMMLWEQPDDVIDALDAFLRSQ